MEFGLSSTICMMDRSHSPLTSPLLLHPSEPPCALLCAFPAAVSSAAAPGPADFPSGAVTALPPSRTYVGLPIAGDIIATWRVEGAGWI